MSSSPNNPHDDLPSGDQPSKGWFESELRNVPLPEDLAARLKGIAAANDETIDATLREVAIPAGLMASLKSVPADLEFDRRLREVPVPASLSAKLHAISALTDEEIDSQLCDVEVPATLAANLRGIAQLDLQTHRNRRQTVNWVLAASLMIAASIAYFSVAGNLIMAMYTVGDRPAVGAPTLESNEQLEVLASFSTTETLEASAELSTATPQFLDEEEPVIARVDVAFEVLEAALPAPSLTAEVRELFSPATTGYANPLTDIFLAKHDFLATPVADTTPEMKTVDSLALRGVTPPLVAAADWQSLIVEGKHPLVSPAADPLLKKAQVPLSVSTLGYDLVWRDLLSGRMPSTNNLRTEDFLASQNYGFDLPREQPLGLRTAAGPAPFGEAGYSLLQIGVPAEALRAMTQPVQVTLAIDGSLSMSQSGRLAQLQRALVQWETALMPDDRLSVVVLGETNDVLLENGTREELARLVTSLNSYQAQGVMNLAGGLREAALLARETADTSHRQRLVLVTDGLKDLSPSISQQLEAMAADLAREAMPVDVIQLLPGEASADKRLVEIARAGRGHFYPAEAGEAIRSVLAEVSAGTGQLAAKGAKLEVMFRPEVVAEYRLVGHEPTGSGGLVGGPLETNLQAGQVATALFEIKLKAAGGDDVGTATLTWIDAQTGEKHTLQQRISRLQFATSILESPVSLQRAAYAAQVAEVLRLSRSSAARTAGLKRIAQLAWQLPTHTRDDASFNQLMQLVDLAVQVQTGRTARP
jgi:hypothetical protein